MLQIQVGNTVLNFGLLVVDMQNGFVSKGGSYAISASRRASAVGADVEDRHALGDCLDVVDDVVQPDRQLVESSRSNGVTKAFSSRPLISSVELVATLLQALDLG